MNIRPFNQDDLAAILDLQKKNPQAAQWKKADYARVTEDADAMVLVAELESEAAPQVVGFAAVYRVIDEAELRNLAVAPEYQHQGIGRALLEETHRRLIKDGTARVYLEVRSSNQPAQRLYYSLGYRLLGARKGYYQDPQEEAYLMSLYLSRSFQ